MGCNRRSEALARAKKSRPTSMTRLTGWLKLICDFYTVSVVKQAVRRVAIVSACRTAVGAFGGSLKSLRAPQLAAVVMREAV